MAAVGNNEYGQRHVGNWTDIVAVFASGGHTVGLRSDGTVVAAGYNPDGQCNVGNWTDIVAVSAGSFHTVGLKSDGTVVAAGYNPDGQCNVEDWKLFNSVDTLKQEREKAKAERRHLKEDQQKREKAERERREQLAFLRERQQALRAELTDLSGLFSGRRRNEIKAKLSEIEKGIEYYMNYGK